MNNKKFIIFLVSCFTAQFVGAVELKDATLRDENISATFISVNYFTRDDGLLEYVYTIESSPENKGEIDGLLIDLYCDKPVEPVSLPYADGKEGYMGGAKSTAKYSPTAIHADYGSAAPYGITENNEALWGLAVSPGKTTTGLRLISSYKPGIRTYVITPWVDYSEGGWNLPEDLSLVPKAHDFAITGMIAAPGCPGVTEPPSEENLFAGTGFRVEPETVNELLQYSSPQKDRFHVDAGTKETEIHIYYDENIDAKTFKVQPAYLKHYFNPVAGTNEKVTLPLKKSRNKMKLSVHTTKVKGSTRKENQAHHSYKDTDVFEIRVDSNKN